MCGMPIPLTSTSDTTASSIVNPSLPFRVFHEQDLVAIYRLRVEAYASILDTKAFFPDGLWMDEYDAHACHWAIKKDGVLAASARLSMASNVEDLPHGTEIKEHVADCAPPFFILSRLVVAPWARNNGYSKLLDKARLQTIVNHGCGTVFARIGDRVRAVKLPSLGLRQASGFEAIKTFPIGKIVLPLKGTLFMAKHSEIRI